MKISEVAPPGREKQVKKLKKKFDDPGAPYAIAWAQHNKHGKPKKNEGKMSDIDIDIKTLSDADFEKKYGKSKAQMQKDLAEQDVPTQKGRDAKPDVLTPRAMNVVKKQIKKDANKQRRADSKKAVDVGATAVMLSLSNGVLGLKIISLIGCSEVAGPVQTEAHVPHANQVETVPTPSLDSREELPEDSAEPSWDTGFEAEDTGLH